MWPKKKAKVRGITSELQALFLTSPLRLPRRSLKQNPCSAVGKKCGWSRRSSLAEAFSAPQDATPAVETHLRFWLGNSGTTLYDSRVPQLRVPGWGRLEHCDARVEATRVLGCSSGGDSSIKVVELGQLEDQILEWPPWLNGSSRDVLGQNRGWVSTAKVVAS